MAHSIHGFISGGDRQLEVFEDMPHARGIPLSQGFVFLPSGDEVLEDVRALVAGSPVFAGPWFEVPPDWDWDACPMLFPEDVRFARWLSMRGPVAWIETDYFGGVGFQSAAAWLQGEAVVGPLKTGAGTTLEDGAINRALRHIGVECKGSYDEFDTLGLGQHRGNEEWIERAHR